MRALGALCLLLAVAAAEDRLHLRHGGMLRGRIVAETPEAIEIEVGAGRMTVARRLVRLVERGAVGGTAARNVTQRDEWFLVLHRGRLVGWRRLVQTEGPRRVQVEERTVFFRPGGGDDVDIRRVEVADREGNPLEFLYMEAYGNDMEVVSGQVARGRCIVEVRRGGRLATRELELPDGWRLALPAWARFEREAKPGETRVLEALDPRRLAPVKLRLHRDRDAAAPDARPARAIRLAGDFRPARSLFRPDEGALTVELNGPSLVARRSTRERVEMARRAHRGPQRLGLEEAKRYPFHERPADLTTYHARAGLVLRAPDAGWIPDVRERERGRVLAFEKVGLFASVEAFAYDLPRGESGIAACFDRARARVRLTVESFRPAGKARTTRIDGRPARILEFRCRHRGEELRSLLLVVRAGDRYVVLLAASPERWWRWARPAFDEFFESLEIAD